MAEWANLRAASGDRHPVGIGTEYDDGLQLRAVERQEVALVLEQNRAAHGDVACNRIALRILQGDRRVLLGTVEEAMDDDDTEETPELFIDQSRRDSAGIQQG